MDVLAVVLAGVVIRLVVIRTANHDFHIAHTGRVGRTCRCRTRQIDNHDGPDQKVFSKFNQLGSVNVETTSEASALTSEG